MKNNQARITIVGAGPGDPELLTIKGMKRLATANVVLYDALANKALLAYTPKDAIHICVGKRAGQRQFPQTDIQLLMVQYALTHGHVVRLKGGDPFVFGRGFEEVSYARALGIEPEVVPGLSSATALPGLQGVPITSRGYSEGFWVITGTTRTGQLSSDIALAAQSKSTVVILMGMRKLSLVVDQFAKAGQSQLPAMVISSGSTTNESVALGTVATIVEKVKEKRLATPGILVFGDTVALHQDWIDQYNTKLLTTNQPIYHDQRNRA